MVVLEKITFWEASTAPGFPAVLCPAGTRSRARGRAEPGRLRGQSCETTTHHFPDAYGFFLNATN